MSKPGDRVAFSPGEFAALFGKSQTWGYRQIYAGKVKTITQHGRILIPAADVERILAEAGIYNGEKKRVAKVVSKAELWKRFVAATKGAQRNDGKPKRSATLARLRPATAKDGKSAPPRFRKA
jgi:hypothetical protein